MCIPLGFLDDATLRDVSELPIRELSLLAHRLKEACETQERRIAKRPENIASLRSPPIYCNNLPSQPLLTFYS
ncbi:hypothetical protein AGMMS49949_01400 [Alphaproteobacteria bacterium]|nr:hypothetical protein AGMMS49949_01400 [Alphaproteobacteria bacterium]GHS97075.1 hypothetical protein AGMMS50296_3750 [Alphaproteobacteria bacterium]